MIRGLIFDFDGLILDTEVPIFQSWKEIYAQYGCELTLEAWSHTIGSSEYNEFPLKELERQLERQLDSQVVLAQQHERERSLIEEQDVLPGVRDYLQRARQLGLEVAVASSSNRAWVEGHLERLGLREYFECVRASDDVRRTKPDPELFLHALACLHLPAEQAIAFEDSPHGVQAAKTAGLYCVAVPNALTRQLDTDHADLVLESLEHMSLEALIRLVEAQRTIK